MSKITIPKIRPTSWKVYVQGKQEAEYVRSILGEAGIDITEPNREPGLTNPPLYAMNAAPKADATLTEEELVAILEEHDDLELKFNLRSR